MSTEYAVVAELAAAFADGVETLTGQRPLAVGVAFEFAEFEFSDQHPADCKCAWDHCEGEPPTEPGW